MCPPCAQSSPMNDVLRDDALGARDAIAHTHSHPHTHTLSHAHTHTHTHPHALTHSHTHTHTLTGQVRDWDSVTRSETEEWMRDWKSAMLRPGRLMSSCPGNTVGASNVDGCLITCPSGWLITCPTYDRVRCGTGTR